MNWAHYRVVLARLGVLAFGLLGIYLIGTVVQQAKDISKLTDRLATEQARFRDQQTTNDATAGEQRRTLLEGIAALKLAVGTSSSPEVQSAINELLARVANPVPGPPGPTGPTGATGAPGPAGANGATASSGTTSTVPATSTSTTRPTTTTTSPKPTTTTTRRGCVNLGVVKVGC